MNRVPQQFVEERPQQPPVFTTHLQSYDRLTEQQSVHLEATVEPKTDPNLRVEWSKNGVPLMTGTWGNVPEEVDDRVPLMSDRGG